MHCEITQTCFFFRHTCSDGVFGGDLLEKFEIHMLQVGRICSMLYYCMVWKPEIKLRKTSKQKCLKKNTEACSPIPLPKHLLSRLRLSADCSRVVPMWLARTGQKKIKHVAMSLPLPCIFLPPSLPWRLQQATVNLAKGHWLWHLHRAELSEREPTPKKTNMTEVISI